MRLLAFFLIFAMAASFAQYYDISVVRANDSTAITGLVYDNNATAYKDNGLENPDAKLRICANSSSVLLNRYVILAYADGFDGDYIQLTHFPVKITNVTPSFCAYVPLEISSFRAWYPSIPYVFISTSLDMSAASRWKLTRLTGWFIGNYTVNRTQIGNQVNITVTNATDDLGAEIVPDVEYLVVGLVRSDFTTMDTAISSPQNVSTLLADSATANYSVFINGIGPNIPPYVRIITPENGKEYAVTTIPFTYIMIDDDGIANCWYVLDSKRTDLPVCGPAYILTGLRDGTHHLALYANDSSGNIASDSVTFKVKTKPPTPPTPGGGGGTGIPIYQEVPIVPPSEKLFILNPENIFIILDYPKEGTAAFNLTSTVHLDDVYCYVKSDFENYTRIKLEKTTIEINETIRGNITVSMQPLEIFDYNKGLDGYIQCIGHMSPELLASTIGNVYLTINKPEIAIDNVTNVLPIVAGNSTEKELAVQNIGPGNTTAINLTAVFTRYQFLFRNVEITQQLKQDEYGVMRFIVSIPKDMPEGDYYAPIIIYENGRQVGQGYLRVHVIKPEVPPPPTCNWPDLGWTVIILLVGIVLSALAYGWRKNKQEKELKMQKNAGSWFERNKMPLAYAGLVMAFFLLVWLLVFLYFLKCEIPIAECTWPNLTWTSVILLMGVAFGALTYGWVKNRVLRMQREATDGKTSSWFERNKIPFACAGLVMAFFLLLWLLVFKYFFRCEVATCNWPNLAWTLIILLIGLAPSLLVYGWRRDKQEKALRMQKEANARNGKTSSRGTWFERNKMPLAYAGLVMAFFLLVWLLVFLLLLKCT
ncbi:MAG: hypothetical protein V1492_02950 [Candidatus Micrarchaeota archaeon]